MTEVELSAASHAITGGWGFWEDADRIRHPYLYPDPSPRIEFDLFPRARRLRAVAHDWRWRFVYAWRALRGDDFDDRW